MTIKELKEKINENPRKLNVNEEYLVVQMELLKLFNEDLKVGKVIQNHFINFQVTRALKSIYKKYDDTLVNETKKFIDFASKRLPNFIFDYELINEDVSKIKYKCISKNKLKYGSILYQKGDISILCYTKYMDEIIHSVEEREEQ